MADGDKRGEMKGNMERILAQRTPVGGTSPQTEEELAAYVQILDWINTQGGRGAAGRGGPLSSLLSQGQKVPAEMYGPNWPKGRHNPLTWLRERFGGAKVPGSREGQWLYSKGEDVGWRRQAGSFANPPTWVRQNKGGIPSRSWQAIQAMEGGRGPIPREFKSGQQIGRDAHSIVSAKLNRILGEPKAGEAWNSPARISAAKKLGLLRGLPIAGAVGSAAYDTYRFATEPDYSMGEYGLDQAENASWLGGVGTGILGSGARAVGEEVWDSLKEGTSAFRNLTDLKKLKWILSQDYP